MYRIFLERSSNEKEMTLARSNVAGDLLDYWNCGFIVHLQLVWSLNSCFSKELFSTMQANKLGIISLDTAWKCQISILWPSKAQILMGRQIMQKLTCERDLHWQNFAYVTMQGPILLNFYHFCHWHAIQRRLLILDGHNTIKVLIYSSISQLFWVGMVREWKDLIWSGVACGRCWRQDGGIDK